MAHRLKRLSRGDCGNVLDAEIQMALGLSVLGDEHNQLCDVCSESM